MEYIIPFTTFDFSGFLLIYENHLKRITSHNSEIFSEKSCQVLFSNN